MSVLLEYYYYQFIQRKGSTKGSRPVQGASLTHTQITITYIRTSTIQKITTHIQDYNKNMYKEISS